MKSKLRCVVFGHDLVPTLLARDGVSVQTKMATCARCEYTVAFEYAGGAADE